MPRPPSWSLGRAAASTLFWKNSSTALASASDFLALLLAPPFRRPARLRGLRPLHVLRSAAACSAAAASGAHRLGPAGLDRQVGADRGGQQQQCRERPRPSPAPRGACAQLPQLVSRRRRARLDRVARQVTLDVAGKAAGRLVTPGSVLLQRLHHDPVELAADQLGQPGRFGLALRGDRRQPFRRLAEPRARLGRLFLLDPPQDLGVARLAQRRPLQRRATGQELVKQARPASRCRCGCRPRARSSRPARGSCIPACRRSDPYWVNIVRSVSRWSIALATPKSITLGTGLPSYMRHQHVGGLDVAVDDPLLMGVLDCLADRHEQLEPLARAELSVVAVLGDGDAVDQLHDEVRTARVGCPGVEDTGDVLVVHQGQGLALGLEACDDLVRCPCPA